MNQADTLLYGAAASREIDAHAIAHLGVDGYELMQRAADATFDVLLKTFPGIKSISVCCGKGNNAGDAYLVALRTLRYGVRTQVVAAVDPIELSGDAATAYADAVQAGVEVADITAPLTGEVIVDGLLGTGLNGAPREPFGAAIDAINASGQPVLSIDVPSGVSTDTGSVFGKAVRATVTVSFITRKLGLYTGAGVSHAGTRMFADLSIPNEMYVAKGIPMQSWDAAVLPALDANTYKHRRGHVVVAGGDESMPGAVAMAATAALRVGAGMVTAVTRPQHSAAIVSRTPEVMVQGFGLGADNSDAQDVMQRADVLVVGPGMGRSDWSEALFEAAQQSGLPTLVDADGLFWLAQRDRWTGGALTITPHQAEAARLLNSAADEVQGDRLKACVDLSQRYGCCGVLKGAGSVVFSNAGAIVGICAHGNPGMATAGMGDVLSGVLGGLLAAVYAETSSALKAVSSLAAGVALHSAAGDAAAQHYGERSLLATDVITELPGLMQTRRVS